MQESSFCFIVKISFTLLCPANDGVTPVQLRKLIVRDQDVILATSQEPGAREVAWLGRGVVLWPNPILISLHHGVILHRILHSHRIT